MKMTTTQWTDWYAKARRHVIHAIKDGVTDASEIAVSASRKMAVSKAGRDCAVGIVEAAIEDMIADGAISADGDCVSLA